MDRPGWQELMAALHADGVRVVLIEKLDRQARDLMVQESVIADLGSACEPDLMATDATRVLLCQMLAPWRNTTKLRLWPDRARRPRRAAVKAANLTVSVKANNRFLSVCVNCVWQACLITALRTN
jgi:hypothetical protein